MGDLLKFSISKLFLSIVIIGFIVPSAFGQVHKFQNSKPGRIINQSIVIKAHNNDLLYFWLNDLSIMYSRSSIMGRPGLIQF